MQVLLAPPQDTVITEVPSLTPVTVTTFPFTVTVAFAGVPEVASTAAVLPVTVALIVTVSPTSTEAVVLSIVKDTSAGLSSPHFVHLLFVPQVWFSFSVF